MSTFLVSVKSTIDKLAHALAVYKGVSYVDLDDVTATAALFRSEDTAIVVEYGTFEPDPKDPLYAGTFRIGARTVQDPANYSLLKLMGDVEAMFPKDDRILIYDSWETTESGVQGVLTPGDTIIVEQQYDLSSGFRLLEVSFKAQRLL